MEKVEKEVKGCKISDQGVPSTFPDDILWLNEKTGCAAK